MWHLNTSPIECCEIYVKYFCVVINNERGRFMLFMDITFRRQLLQ